MNMIIELVTKEAESCLKGGVIEGLSRFEQINHDIKIMMKVLRNLLNV